MKTDSSARRAKRLKIFEPFALVDENGERRAHLLDISETGGLVHCEGAHIEGAAITAIIQGRAFAATVAWSKAPRLGVAFSEPLAANVIRTLIER